MSFLRPIAVGACGVAMTLGFVLPALADRARQEQLGVVEAGQTVELGLDRIVPAARLRIELDGTRITTPFGVRGETLTLRIPDNLRGLRHDIVVYLDGGESPVELGSWEFETTGGAWNLSGAYLGETGFRGAEGRNEDYGRAAGRIDADVDEGRVRARLSFVLNEREDPDTGDRWEIPDWFVENRMSIAGHGAWARIGTQYFPTEGALIDDYARRGASFRLGDPADRFALSLFAVQTTQPGGSGNLAGISDASDRVFGVAGHVLPVDSASARLGFAAYGGKAPGEEGAAFDVSGREISLVGPIGQRIDYLLSYATSSQGVGQDTREGDAFVSEVTLGLLPVDDARSLGLTFGYERIDLDFTAPLNSQLIAGEETLSGSLDFTSDAWTWSLEGARARTNAGGPDSNPVDHLGRLGFQLSYSPRIFTGGFLNGTTFYFGAEQLTQDRQTSPVGAPDPTDHTIRRLSLGFDRFQPDHSIAFLYTRDVIDDRSGSSDETIQGLEGLVTFTGLDGFTASAGGRAALTDGEDGRYWEVTASAGLSIDLIPDKLVYGLETGITEFIDTNQPEGGYVAQELAYEVFDGHDLVFSAEYGYGEKTPRLVTDQGWEFGLAWRTDVGFSSRR